jgi:hypothetical protein
MDAGLPRGAIACIDTRHGRLARLWPPAVWTDVPPGTRTVSEREKSSYAAHLMGRLALKLSSSSMVPFKFLIPPLACALNRMGAPRDKPLGCSGEACRDFTALRYRRADPSSNLRRPRCCMHPRR